VNRDTERSEQSKVKRPYNPPEVKSEPATERLALASVCGLPETNQEPNCTML